MMIYLLEAALGAAVFVFFFYAWRLARNVSTGASVRKLYDRISRESKLKMEQYEQEQLLYGDTEQKNFLYKLHFRLIYSGVRQRLPWLNEGIYISLSATISCILFAAGVILLGNLAAGLALAAGFVWLLHGGVNLLMELNYRRTEKYLIPFMNLVENYAVSYDDLLVILENAGRMTGDPIRGEILDTVARARRSGDAYRAIHSLQENIEHPHFKRLMGNLEKCSRGSADYRRIIDSSRGAAERYLAAGKELREVYKNGRGEILIMSAGGIFLMSMMKGLTGTEKGIMEVFMENMAGRAVLSTLVLIFGSAVWFCLFGGKRRT